MDGIDETPSFVEGTLPKLFTREEAEAFNQERQKQAELERKKASESVSIPPPVKRQEKPKTEVIEQPKPKPVETPKTKTTEKPKPVEKPKEVAPPAPVEKAYTEDVYVVTAYTNGAESTGKNPGDAAYGITASGNLTVEGRTIAVDPSVIPMGTKVEINGHVYVAEDKGGAVKGRRIDLFMESYDEAIKFGRQTLKVKIYN